MTYFGCDPPSRATKFFGTPSFDQEPPYGNRTGKDMKSILPVNRRDGAHGRISPNACLLLTVSKGLVNLPMLTNYGDGNVCWIKPSYHMSDDFELQVVPAKPTCYTVCAATCLFFKPDSPLCVTQPIMSNLWRVNHTSNKKTNSRCLGASTRLQVASSDTAWGECDAHRWDDQE